MKEIKIGLLPLYIALYDTAAPQLRPVAEKFATEICKKLTAEKLTVIPSPVCCIKSQFENAIRFFENEKVDAVITLHLAYSPSLESSDVLAKTELPIIVLDTTPNYLFDETINSEAILNNHGIHGVQDMCNLLRRNKKDFEIFAGHYEKSDVCKKAADCVRAIAAAKSLKSIRVGIVGKTFEGMGDFLVSKDTLCKLGVITVNCSTDDLLRYGKAVTETEIKEEYNKDKKLCDLKNIDFAVYKKTEKIALSVRKWISAKKLGAFTMNFQSAGEMPGFETIPFSEAGKEMAMGIGYAGEGDILTAALAGSLSAGFENVSFAEMFCPNWQNGSVFLSHMGEANLNILDNPHMIIKDFPYADGFNPTCIMGHMKAGEVCLVNIAPNKDGSFDIIIADGTMLPLLKSIGTFDDAISGWFKPETPLEIFLENYSRAGGTHHSAIVYGTKAEIIKIYAQTLKLNFIII